MGQINTGTRVLNMDQGEIKECPHCHKKTKAVFPEGVTHEVQYGFRNSGSSSLSEKLSTNPLERTIQLFRDLFNTSP